MRHAILALVLTILPFLDNSYNPLPIHLLMMYGPSHVGSSLSPFLCFWAVFSRSTSVPTFTVRNQFFLSQSLCSSLLSFAKHWQRVWFKRSVSPLVYKKKIGQSINKFPSLISMRATKSTHYLWRKSNNCN